MFESEPATEFQGRTPNSEVQEFGVRPWNSMIVNSAEANYWWRKNDPAGALLNNLMFLFVVAPIILVLKSFYTLSFMVFALMVPYGLFVRWLAIRAVRRYLENHPEECEKFEETRIIST